MTPGNSQNDAGEISLNRLYTKTEFRLFVLAGMLRSLLARLLRRGRWPEAINNAGQTQKSESYSKTAKHSETSTTKLLRLRVLGLRNYRIY